jgi:DNA-binding NtrC family response regulator
MSSDHRDVMVVDDEPDLLTITTKMLETDGYKVHGFGNSVKALEHVETNGCNECSFLVSDIRMPTINGIELAKRIKKLRPEMKIILMTAFEIHKNEWQKTLPSAQVDEFIQKPISTRELVEAIKKCANGSAEKAE